jgi:transcriptional regulator with XRE-family HTH domain
MVRRDLKLGRTAMAARLMVKPNSYHKNENGQTFPNAKSLKILHNEFGISMEWLIFNQGPMYIKDLEAADQLKIHKERLQESDTRRQELSRQLEDAKKRLEPFAWIEEAGTEMKEFLQAMANDPQLRFEVLAHFFKHKKG